MNRRTFLNVVGVAGIGGGAGYVQFRQSGDEGRVFWRQMAVDAGGEPGSLVVVVETLGDDRNVEREIHPDYSDAFENGTRVPKTLHRNLRHRFGSDEPYYLLRYEAQDCNGLPGDEGGGTLEVSRPEFNRSQLGDCVKR